jgi:hypothetical protein
MMQKKIKKLYDNLNLLGFFVEIGKEINEPLEKIIEPYLIEFNSRIYLMEWLLER